jgi:hypothetical protein
MATLRYLVVLAMIFVALSVTCADTIVSETLMFTGMNIYSPSLIYDNGVYKMWYGGWQTQSDYPNDKIYYRTSTDNVNWSAPITVLTPGDIGPNVVHVNDPSVTKHFNTTSGQWQYTMFYTICINTCHPADNQVWSSVSGDGIHWLYNQNAARGIFGAIRAIRDCGEPTEWRVLEGVLRGSARPAQDKNGLSRRQSPCGVGQRACCVHPSAKRGRQHSYS